MVLGSDMLELIRQQTHRVENIAQVTDSIAGMLDNLRRNPDPGDRIYDALREIHHHLQSNHEAQMHRVENIAQVTDSIAGMLDNLRRNPDPGDRI